MLPGLRPWQTGEKRGQPVPLPPYCYLIGIQSAGTELRNRQPEQYRQTETLSHVKTASRKKASSAV